MDTHHIQVKRPDFSTTPIGVGVGVGAGIGVSPGIGVGVGPSTTSTTAATSTTTPINTNGNNAFANMLDVGEEDPTADLPPEFFEGVDDAEHDVTLQAAHQVMADQAGLQDMSLLQGDAGVPMLPGEEYTDELAQEARRPRKRKLQLACHFCRRRKLKCDGVHPACENCVRRHEVCTWDDTVRRRGPGRRTKQARDKAAEDAVAAGLHDAGGLKLDAYDTVDTSLDHADGVDTNAALIAAVTAAAAEGQGLDPDAFGGEHVTGTDQYHLAPLPTATVPATSPHLSPNTALLQSSQSGTSPLPLSGVGVSHHSTPAPTSASLPMDPNIDPSLTDLGSIPPSPKKQKRKMDPVGVAVQPGLNQSYGIGVGQEHKSQPSSATSQQQSQSQQQQQQQHEIKPEANILDLDDHSLDANFDLNTQYGLQEWDETHL